MNNASDLPVKDTAKLLSDNQRQLFALANFVILGGFVCLFGSVANVINLIVFYRQGLDTTINISFFSLAVADLCGLIVQQLFNTYDNPLVVNLRLPIIYTQFQYLTTGIMREVFAQITCMITAFITAERCLCVVFPLKVKRVITPRITTTAVLFIYFFSLMSAIPFYSTSYFAWKFYPDSNKTLLALAFTKHNDIMEAVVYLIHAIFVLSVFLSVLTFTLILIYKLGQKSAWRQLANVDVGKAKSMSKRDRATITMVVLIAVILIACYTPAVMLSMASVLEPELSGWGSQYNLYNSCWSIALLLENINSSVNIYLYYKMSTKYRQTFHELIFKKAVPERESPKQ